MTKFLNISTDTTLGGSNPSDDVVASQKAIKTAVDTKQDTLVSGTNIKTINNESLLGSGNINVSGGGTGMMTGMIVMYGKNAVPTGFLACDGSAVSRTTYADLFDVIGTTYGDGDGSTTFNLPDFTSRVPEGGTPGTYIGAGLPNITGNITWTATSGTYTNGCFYVATTGKHNHKGGDGYNFTTGTVNLNASRSSNLYGASSTVQPPALCTKFCIKY